MSDDVKKWKNKYYDSLDDLEQMEKDWTQMSTSLSRSMIRIVMATEGLNTNIDGYLKDVGHVLRAGTIDAKVIERMELLSSALAHTDKKTVTAASTPASQSTPEAPQAKPNAVKSTKRKDAKVQLGLFTRLLDRIPPPPGQEQKIKALREELNTPHDRTASIKEILLIYGKGYKKTDASIQRILASASQAEHNSNDTHDAFGPDVREVLLQLIDGLSLPPVFSDRLDDIKQDLCQPGALEKWMLILSGIIEIILEIQRQTVAEKSELQAFLGQVTERLQELDQNLALEVQDQHVLLAEEEKLNHSVEEDVEQIQSSVNDATSLAHLKETIQERLDGIRQHMQHFRQFGHNRAEIAETRIREMNQKIRALETETEHLQDKIAQEHAQSLLDALTKVPNRLAYDHHLATEYARWKRYEDPLSMIIWDIDYFKKVNDTYGHQAGDNALKFIADILAKRVRETDFLARFGGEEFVTLLPETTATEAKKLADEVRQTIERASFRYAEHKVNITISAGVSEFKRGDGPEQAFKRADQALYVSKNNGRNCISIL